jgi:hypothetical protein
MCKIDDENRIEKQFISSQVFHRTTGGRIQEITVKNNLNYESLNLLIQQIKNYTDISLQQFTHNTTQNRLPKQATSH